MHTELTIDSQTTQMAIQGFWAFSGELASIPSVGSSTNWLSSFRMGLRGMSARIEAVYRNLNELHRYQESAKCNAGNPNEQMLIMESYVGSIFFGMDSTLECFTHALNALGSYKSPHDFCDMSNPTALRQIGPKNIVCNDPCDTANPKSGYAKVFPDVVAYWTKHQSLIITITEYHDVSKHRCAIALGASVGMVHLTDDPRSPVASRSSDTFTVELIVRDYQAFVEQLLPMALRESKEQFGLEK